MGEVLIRQVSPLETPLLYSQVLNLRNEVLRIPIGLDLFQEDLSQEVNFLIIAATTTPIFGKSKENNSSTKSNSLEQIDGATSNEGDLTGSTNNLEYGQQQDEKVIGCVVLKPIEKDAKSFQLAQMAVSPNVQGQRIGTKLLQNAEMFAKQLGKSRIMLHARVTAIPFYVKAGYTQITRNEYLMLGIPHQTLEKILL